MKNRLRKVTGVFLVVAGILLTAGAAWLMAFDSETYYRPPYYCQVLWCDHDRTRTSDGREVCAKWPPAEIMRTRVSTGAKRMRLGAAFLTGILGLGCAALPAVVGVLGLRGRLKPEPVPVLRWVAIVLGAGFIAAPMLAVATVWLKALYGFVPK